MSNYRTQYERDLKIKGFSERTVGTYRRHVDSCLSHFHDEIDLQSSTQVKDFLHYLMLEKKVSRSYMHQCYSALKYFYTTTLNEDWAMMKILRAKRTKKLPEILSREEIGNLLNVTRNIKHKAILMVPTVLSLKPFDLRHHRVLQYLANAQGLAELKNKLTERLKTVAV